MSQIVQQIQKRMLVSLSQVAKKLNIHEGDHVLLEVRDGGIFIKPVSWHDKDQEYFWSEPWQNKIAESANDLKEGYYKEFDNPDDLLKDLDGE